jgi:MFS family permease
LQLYFGQNTWSEGLKILKHNRSFGGGITRALSNRNFGIYTAGNMPSLIGIWAQRLASGWLMWEMTRSPAMLGWLGFVDLIPFVIVSPFAGLITDRFDKILLARIIKCMAMSIAVALMLLTFSGKVTPELILLLGFLTGVTDGLFQPVRTSLASVMVPRDTLASAVAINSLVFNIARFIGPAVAGLILTLAGAGSITIRSEGSAPIKTAADVIDVGWVFLYSVLSYLFFLTALFLVKIQDDAPQKSTRPRVLEELFEGVRYSVSHPAIGPLFLMVGAVAIFIRPVMELLPGFADDAFNRGKEGYVMLVSMIGMGAMFSGFWIGWRGRIDGLLKIGLVSSAVMGGSVVLFSLTKNFSVAIGCMLVFGGSQMLIGTAFQTMVQSSADPGLRGRVMSIFGLLWVGSIAFGAAAIGLFGEVFGLPLPTAIFALLGLIICAYSLKYFRQIRDSVEASEK